MEDSDASAKMTVCGSPITRPTILRHAKHAIQPAPSLKLVLSRAGLLSRSGRGTETGIDPGGGASCDRVAAALSARRMRVPVRVRFALV
jgi:hypothetical protein